MKPSTARSDSPMQVEIDLSHASLAREHLGGGILDCVSPDPGRVEVGDYGISLSASRVAGRIIVDEAQHALSPDHWPQDTEIRFGETYQVVAISENQGWLEVCLTDNHTVWIEHHRHTWIPQESFERLSMNGSSPLVEEPALLVSKNDPDRYQPVFVEIGDHLPFFNRKSAHCIGPDYLDHQVQPLDRASLRGFDDPREMLKALIWNTRGEPYHWGGRDCSGWIQSLFKYLGHKFPRDAGEQITHGTHVNSLSESQPGDLVFYSGEKGINHVGIIFRGGDRPYLAHVKQRVRIEPLDKLGLTRSLRWQPHDLAGVRSYRL